MHFIAKSILIGAALCSLAVSSARAEIFFVEDQDDRFSVSFPDLWAKVDGQKPDDKLTVLGPGDNDLAACRVRVREDRRFLIYPHNMADSIQHVAISKDFWTDYLGEYDDVTIDFFKDDAGLGRGHASMVEASYTNAEGTIAHKRGLMFASLYNGRLFVVDCSSEQSFYPKWRQAFLGIVKSIDFQKTDSERLNGHYRPFPNDPDTVVQGENPYDEYHF